MVKKKRKSAAILLALALSVSMLSGCSAADMGFFSLYNEISNLNSYSFSAEFDIKVEDEMSLKLNVSGDVTYTDLSDIYLDLLIKYGVNSKDTPRQVSLKLYNNVVYMPVKDFIEFTIETYKLDGKSSSMCEKIKSEFLKGAGEYDYVILFDLSESYQMMAFSGMLMYSEEIIAGQEEIEKIIINSIKEMFSGVESGMTKAVSNGYALEADPDKVIKFIDNLVNYTIKNKDKIYREVVKLYNSLEPWLPEEEEFDLDKKSFDEFISELESEYKENFSEWEKEYGKLLFNGSRVNVELTKNGGKYVQNYDIKIHYRGSPLFSVKGKTAQDTGAKINEKTVETKNPISLADLNVLLKKAERKVNYVKQAEFSWWSGSYRYYDDDEPFRWASVSLDLVEGKDWDYIDYVNDFGSIFVPMRQICDWFGEEVIWDSAEKKAYVDRAGNMIEMTGKIIEGRTFIKIRDFEKLGYGVNYEHNPDWGEHRVWITKSPA